MEIVFFTSVRMHTQILFSLSQPPGSFRVHFVRIFAGCAHLLTKEIDKSLKRMECSHFFLRLLRELYPLLCVLTTIIAWLLILIFISCKLSVK